MGRSTQAILRSSSAGSRCKRSKTNKDGSRVVLAITGKGESTRAGLLIDGARPKQVALETDKESPDQPKLLKNERKPRCSCPEGGVVLPGLTTPIAGSAEPSLAELLANKVKPDSEGSRTEEDESN